MAWGAARDGWVSAGALVERGRWKVGHVVGGEVGGF